MRHAGSVTYSATLLLPNARDFRSATHSLPPTVAMMPVHGADSERRHTIGQERTPVTNRISPFTPPIHAAAGAIARAGRRCGR